MFHRKNNLPRVTQFGRSVPMLALLAYPVIAPGGSPRPLRSEVLIGHPLVVIDRAWLGAGLGPYESIFVFGVTVGGSASRRPVKVRYLFFTQKDELPENFFDSTKQYDLRVRREPQCDEPSQTLLATHNADGTPFPPGDGPRFLTNAHALVPDSGVLPCYVLNPGEYRLLTK